MCTEAHPNYNYFVIIDDLEKKVFLQILQSLKENTCARVFFNKVAGLRPIILLKKRLLHRCCPVNFAKFVRTAFLQNTSGQLLL